jgi:LysM repeat protein
MSARRRRQRAGRVIAALLAGVIVFISAGMGITYITFQQYYAERIYPGVHISDRASDFDVGGLTRAEAAARMDAHYARMLAVFDFQGERWFTPWQMAGVTVNSQEAVKQAFKIARQGALDARWAAWQNRQPVLVTYAFDEARSRAFLEQHRADVYLPPTDAQVMIRAGQAVEIAAEPGRELDVDATLQGAFARMLQGEPVPMQVRPVAPALNDVNAPLAQLNTWLGQPLVLQMWWQNVIITRTVSASERSAWVQVQQQSGQVNVQVRDEGIRDFISRLNAEISPDADLRIDEVTGMVRHALLSGESNVWFVAPHKQLTYMLKRGDTFDSLADTFGIPVARILAANPAIWDEGGGVVGQVITIPAQSLMLPLSISPTNRQRIEVNLTTQQLFAYESNTLVLSSSISSGIPKWRTLVGVFQVQEKVDDAYNKLAHIRMPNWLSIYDIGDPGNSLTNGIHALPVLGGGRRLWSGYLGRPVSFGCIVMGIEDSDKLYRWAQLGTPVLVYGKTPPSSLTYDNLIEAQQKTQGGATSAPTPTPGSADSAATSTPTPP